MEGEKQFGDSHPHINRTYDVAFVAYNYSKWYDDTKNWTLAVACFEKLLE